MRRAGLEFVADQVTKFFDTVYIRGWLRSPDDRLATVTLTGAADIQQLSTAGAEDYPGVDGAQTFQLQALTAELTLAEQRERQRLAPGP